jgi:hypothetical protein
VLLSHSSPKKGLTPISCHAVLERSARAPFIKERRMECINATRLRRKSGPWGTQHLLLRDVASPLRAHNPQRGEKTAGSRSKVSAPHRLDLGPGPGIKPKESCPPVAMHSFLILWNAWIDPSSWISEAASPVLQ